MYLSKQQTIGSRITVFVPVKDTSNETFIISKPNFLRPTIELSATEIFVDGKLNQHHNFL